MSSAKTVFHTTNTAGSARINNVNVNGDYIVSNSVYQITDEQRKEVYRWLAAPDSSGNYNAAREKHHADTGSWFIEGKQFLDWKETPDLALWVYGTPGCGKTIIW
ncbi:hypothetical protein FIBSPDRAFT_969253 [Athelia psychrophila]|uniref:Nephrocystin 3-like N-terminal domain-containing protein n=1 Tax=Athelia psychrophila TaxID=1759441 RepID=A0A167TQ08_9AGAM|nr:hypothetical protein FIBSPDRAFT_969253 [Fibularhizoctonia sp. CBS 109695]